MLGERSRAERARLACPGIWHGSRATWGAQYVEATSSYIVFLFISVDGSYYDFQFLF